MTKYISAKFKFSDSFFRCQNPYRCPLEIFKIPGYDKINTFNRGRAKYLQTIFKVGICRAKPPFQDILIYRDNLYKIQETEENASQAFLIHVFFEKIMGGGDGVRRNEKSNFIFFCQLQKPDGKFTERLTISQYVYQYFGIHKNPFHKCLFA